MNIRMIDVVLVLGVNIGSLFGLKCITGVMGSCLLCLFSSLCPGVSPVD